MLDGKPHSADVRAAEEVLCYTFNNDSFMELKRQFPDISYKLIFAIGRELSTRIRIINHIITELKA